MSSPAEIELVGVSKRYGDETAVDDLSIVFAPGALCCLLGRNGAGKTTTIHLIMGLKNPTSGEVRIRGVSASAPEVHAIRRSVGYLPEHPVLYEHLTGREFLQFLADLHGLGAAGRVRLERELEAFGLSSHADAPIRTYSLGTRKKVAFLAATLHEPEILILDEPTGSLDVASAHAVKRLMREYRDRGRLVVFTTHLLEVAEQLSDRLWILRKGALCFEGSPGELRGRAGSGDETLEEIFLRLTAESDSHHDRGRPGPSRIRGVRRRG
jgi:ABC-2 type transport system ATP-binding protein